MDPQQTSAVSATRERLGREAALVAGLLFAGVVLLPIAVYAVGTRIFGDYADGSFGAFFGSLTERLRGFDASAWFLVASPLLAVLLIRLAIWCWRRIAQQA